MQARQAGGVNFACGERRARASPRVVTIDCFDLACFHDWRTLPPRSSSRYMPRTRETQRLPSSNPSLSASRTLTGHTLATMATQFKSLAQRCTRPYRAHAGSTTLLLPSYFISHIHSPPPPSPPAPQSSDVPLDALVLLALVLLGLRHHHDGAGGAIAAVERVGVQVGGECELVLLRLHQRRHQGR